MKKSFTLTELKEKDLKTIKNRPAISSFGDNLSLGSVLEDAYILPRYKLRKHGKHGTGLDGIVNEFKTSKIIFIGQGGTGKTTAFLRLFAGISDNNNQKLETQFHYIFAPDFLATKKLTEYRKELKKIIKKGDRLEGILLLDGLEEAYQSDSKSALSLIERLSESGIVFWVSCRNSFYERLGDKIFPIFDECVELQLWNPQDFDSYVDSSLSTNTERALILQRINNVRNKIRTLLNRPLFATMVLFIAENSEMEDINNEYELIGLFLDKWIEREILEKNTEFDYESCYNSIRQVALDVYLGHRPYYDQNLNVFRDLLWMPRRKGTIHQFYHREFLVYFIVNALLDAALNHRDRIVRWFSQTFYDDITNMMKPVLSIMNNEDSGMIYDNLIYTYKNTYDNKEHIQSEFRRLGLDENKTFLKLRDEIIYFIFKLHDVDHASFAEYVHNHNPETMLSLGIAYGMAGIDPNNNYTLDFARKLIPGNPEEIRNRGWGMCFFGDVEDDGYEYEDSAGEPWKRIRENKLNRLKDDKTKYATRTLDLPLLYCFYKSRGFKDCTSVDDYKVLCNTNVNHKAFKGVQQRFMEEQKNKLVSVYKRNLLTDGLNENQQLIKYIKTGDVSVDQEKIVVEVSRDLADIIIEHIEHKEQVRSAIVEFWNAKGPMIIKDYEEYLNVPEHNNLSEEVFENRIKNCKVLLISANSVEGRTVSWRLMKENGDNNLDAYAADGHLYQFAQIGTIPVVHIWPTDMSSFTSFGSFSAVDAALERFTPQYVISVGVAFGIDPVEQSFGDVLVARDLVFYDNFNKVTDGIIKLRPDDTYKIDANLIAQLHMFDRNTPPPQVGAFKWYFEAMLTGGTVLSDAAEKKQLVKAAQHIGMKIIGGEMEASGIHFACQRIKKRSLPYLVFKGICDWGAEKNGWAAANIPENERDKVKDCVQAFACNNAYDSMSYVLSRLNIKE